MCKIVWALKLCSFLLKCGPKQTEFTCLHHSRELHDLTIFPSSILTPSKRDFSILKSVCGRLVNAFKQDLYSNRRPKFTLVKLAQFRYCQISFQVISVFLDLNVDIYFKDCQGRISSWYSIDQFLWEVRLDHKPVMIL